MHSFIKKNKNYLLVATALCSIGVATIYGVNTSVQAALFDEAGTEEVENKDENERIFATLTGFKPHAKVTYLIQSKNVSPFTALATADENGNLTLPMTADFSNAEYDVKYNFLIDEEEQTMNIMMSHNPKSGELTIEGSGTPSFTRIVIQSDDNKYETQSDWAGLFEEKNISDVIFEERDNTSYKIAFFSTDPSQDIQSLTRSPVITIHSAPGGGGPTNSQVNSTQNGFCGNPQISWCGGDLSTHVNNLVSNFVEPMQAAANQLTQAIMHHTFMIGTFLDAKETLESQRDMQVLNAKANKDYQPSEQLCNYGSYMKTLASTEESKDANLQAFNTILMDHYTDTQNSSSFAGDSSSMKARLKQFRTLYCDPTNNNGGLDYMCEHDQDGNPSNNTYRSDLGASDNLRMNKDIDILRTLDKHYTLNVDFTDNISTEDEADVIALAKNLYWPNAYKDMNPERAGKNPYAYMDARRYIALNNIAHNSFAQQVAMKAKAKPADTTGSDPVIPGWAHMKTLMREFGLDDTEIEAMIGTEPSYYAQMDVLTKKIYQSPDFYTNLYDKPVNVNRIIATLDAISLMQQRDHFEALQRQEMLASGMIQVDLIPEIERINAAFDEPIK